MSYVIATDYYAELARCAVLVAAGGAVDTLGIANPRRVVEAKRCAGGQLVGAPEPAVDLDV